MKQCSNCENQLSDKSIFCGKCKTQVKCLKCKEDLTLDAICCEMCGTDVKQKISSDVVMNRIRYDGHSFEAEFTDKVGKDVTETFGRIFQEERNRLIEGAGINESHEESKTIDIDVQDVTPPVAPITDGSSNLNDINTLFREKDGKLRLVETRIKADSKRNYSIRLTYLVVLYYTKKGEEAPKSTIKELLEYCGIYDGNYRGWFGSVKGSDFMVEGDLVEFRPAGQEKAYQYLNDVFNSEKTGTWNLSNLSRSSGGTKKSGNSKESSKKKKSSASKSITPEPFETRHKSKTLEAFLSEKTSNGTTNKILLIGYYINKILKKPTFTDGNIEYAYKALKLDRRPKHLRQMIINAKNDHLYFEDAEPKGAWKVSRDGEIYVEEKL